MTEPNRMRARAAEYDRHDWGDDADVAQALYVAANQIESVRKMHHQRAWRPLDGTYIGGTYCDHCRRPWPCPTYRATTNEGDINV